MREAGMSKYLLPKAIQGGDVFNRYFSKPSLVKER